MPDDHYTIFHNQIFAGLRPLFTFEDKDYAEVREEVNFMNEAVDYYAIMDESQDKDIEKGRRDATEEITKEILEKIETLYNEEYLSFDVARQLIINFFSMEPTFSEKK